MAAEPVLLVRCDAPGCTKMLETADHKPVFRSHEEVIEAAEREDWLVTRDHKDLERTYCRQHWRWHFHIRTPWWGRRSRVNPGEQEGF